MHTQETLGEPYSVDSPVGSVELTVELTVELNSSI